MSEISMEDVGTISLEVMDLIEKRLKEHGIIVDDKNEDEIYVPLHDAIEKVAGYPDYRSHN